VNRYLAEGVVADLRAGKDILFLTPSRGSIRDYMAPVLGALGELGPGDAVRTASGHESIRSGTGGRVDFVSAYSNLRGRALDVVVLDIDPYSLGEQWLYEFNHGVARKAEVIRW